ncbi:Peptide transporter Ptr2-a protein [Lasiodiplodia theobromae]|uniref:Peptide transporter Ptr2-a protein n=1 Tax=Lasiodiplodia theobromae TaxID=45133 RepID=UPI0015C3D74E|nr:Peptide transporter Ptr2-a protein [Lasiodiplodia theobromae]KAF4536348.1 Peptide transporter Ptr2-a protein [Lasiodiplodia theobromae]
MPPLASTRGDYASVPQAEPAVELQDLNRPHHDRPLARRGHPPPARSGASADSSALDASEVVEAKRHSADTFSNLSVDDDEPTDGEKLSLRKVPDRLPWSASLIAIVELCERFAYYGLSGPFQNYMANKYHDPSGLPGAIGLGQHGATLTSSFFQFWCYLTPIFGAVVADQYLGKYWTIVYFSVVYMSGIVILFLTSLPSSIEAGYAYPGLLVAILVIGLGTGGIKSNVSPLIAEQYEETRQRIKILPSGERVIVDPALTIQRIYMVFYMCINIGSLSAIATSTMELRIGFWAAYLLPLCMFVVGFVLIVVGKNRYVIKPPSGSVVANSFKALYIAIVNQGDLDAAKPSIQRSYAIQRTIQWDDAFVDELKRALLACKVFCFYPIYWAAFGQMSNNFISQAGQMQLHGIPNDIMQNIDPLAVICLIPLLDRYAYPFLRRRGFALQPITRITFGFVFVAMAMAYAAFLQHLIYASEPCFDAPSACAAALRADGSYEPNRVHVALQTPAYLVMALSEILASVTGLEYAFTKAPASMKSFIMALFLLTTALGAVIGGLISPFARDPLLVGLYGGLAVACAVTAGVFWGIFRRYDGVEDGVSGVKDGEE